jgi:ankyrin repeat protein
VNYKNSIFSVLFVVALVGSPLSFAMKLANFEGKNTQIMEPEDFFGFFTESKIATQPIVNTKLSSSNWTPLFYALAENDRKLIEFLVKKGADVQARDICGNTVLHYAAIRSTTEIVAFLLENGFKAVIEAKDGMEQSPLYAACRDGKYDNAKILIEYGADVNIKGVRLYNPSKVMIEDGDNLHIKKPSIDYFEIYCSIIPQAQHGFSPLHIASHEGHDDIVDLLIKKGADINIKNDNHITPLHVAAERGYTRLVKKLLNEGADANAETIETDVNASVPEVAGKKYVFGESSYTAKGITPLFAAITSGKIDVVNELIPFSKIHTTVGSFDASPLHYASLLGHCDIVKAFVKNNANFLLLLRGKHRADEIADSYEKKDIAIFLGGCLQQYRKDMECRSLKERIMYDNSSNLLGVYYRAQDGQIKSVIAADLKKPMVKNHLLNLDYSQCFKKNHSADEYHSFSEDVETILGAQACVVVNTKDSRKIIDINKKWDLYITLPGNIKNQSGVFEFTINKNLYEERGECLHRFFNPKGLVGSQGFGKKNHVSEQKKLVKS